MVEMMEVSNDGRNFYDNPIESNIEKYRELKKVMIGKGQDYTTESLFDFNYFDKQLQLIYLNKKNYMQIREQFKKLNLSTC